MMPLSTRSLSRSIGVCSVVGTMISGGCRSDTTGPVPLDPTHQYFQLTLNHHAVTLALAAPYDTITLLAIPRSATGVTVTDTGTTTYMVLNRDSNVTVSPTGVLRAIAPDIGGQVVASHTIGNLTLADTAIVNVNAVSSVPHFTTFTLATQPGDSAVTSFSSVQDSTVAATEIIPMMLDAHGDAIPNVAFRLTSPLDRYNGQTYCTSSDVDPTTGGCYVSKQKIGRMWISAEATVYGVSKIDSVLYTVGWPLLGTIGVFPRTPAGQLTPIGYFSPGDDTVAVGAFVTWNNMLSHQAADIVFQDPETAQGVDSAFWSHSVSGQYMVIPHQSGGNIPAFFADSACASGVFNPNAPGVCDDPYTQFGVRARQFLTPGTYPYHSVLYGTTGVIHVLPESQVPALTR